MYQICIAPGSIIFHVFNGVPLSNFCLKQQVLNCFSRERIVLLFKTG